MKELIFCKSDDFFAFFDHFVYDTHISFFLCTKSSSPYLSYSSLVSLFSYLMPLVLDPTTMSRVSLLL